MKLSNHGFETVHRTDGFLKLPATENRLYDAGSWPELSSSIRRTLTAVPAGILLVLTITVPVPAQQPLTAPTFTVLHSFTGPPNDGRNPLTGLTMDASGLLYGTTVMGGISNGGTAFVVRPDGSEAVLHSFTGSPSDGGNPSGLTLGADGNFYGTASGGANGLVFKMTAGGVVTVLHRFMGAPNDGSIPASGVIQDAAGNLYGTTSNGGSTGNGVVFKVSPDGTETVLYSFAGAPNDGANPFGLVQDAAGNLYGTTSNGGSTGNGVVFRVSPDGTEAVLYSFAGPANNGGSSSGPPNDGSGPVAGLIADAGGNLYGTTLNGGAYSGGTVFRLSPSGTETLLLSLGGPSGDGRSPRAALVMDGAGNLYGTTSSTSNSGGPAVFELAPDGRETVLHNFIISEGGTTSSWLVLDGARNLFGTTFGSPAAPCSVEGPGGCGIVFKLATPSANLSISTAAPPVVPSGSVVAYVIEVTNNGPDAANNVSIQDAVPAGTTIKRVVISSGSCKAPAPGGTGTVTCTVHTLAAGSTVTETLIVNVAAASGSTITDTASVSSSTFDPNTVDNSSTATTSVFRGHSGHAN